jgi:Ca2+-transporting ATPase
LRAADVGIAIGRDGTAAAREVADVFFATEDLAALPMAIERGRATYENIRRAIHYVLSTNGSEIALMLAGTAAGMGEALAPMQLLWINLVSDVLPAIGLALEPPDADVMRQRPKQANERILTRDHVGRLGTEAGVIAAGAFAAGLYGALRHGHASPQARTVTFGSLVTAQLLHALNYRSTHGAAEGTRNSILPSVIGGSLVAQFAAMLLPGLRNLLGVAAIDVLDAVAMIAGGILPFFVNAGRKTEQVQNTLHFRSVKPDSAPPLQADEARVRGERPSDLTRLPQRAAPAAAPIAATSASDTTVARALARPLQESIP